MGLITVSTKRARVYRRAFDHEQAQALRAQGWSYPKLADHFGVSQAAIQRVCDPKVRERMDKEAKKSAQHARKPCRGGCGRLVWMHAKREDGTPRSGLCATCLAKRSTAADVRDEELRCTQCREWKPDADFPPEQRPSRRGRQGECRACQTARRRRNRHQNKQRERELARNYKRKGKAMSVYVVLCKTEEGLWEERDRVQASSRMHAVERVADHEGIWAAMSQGQIAELEVKSTVALKVVANGDGPSE